MRVVTTAMPNVARRRTHPGHPTVTKTMMPRSAPQITPEIVKVPSKYPAIETTAFATTAVAMKARGVEANDATASSLTSDTHQRTAAAVAGTETLSSSRMGMVSTAAAATAATKGTATENHR